MTTPDDDSPEIQLNIPLVSLPLPCAYLELPWERHSLYSRLATHPLKKFLENTVAQNDCCDLYKGLCFPIHVAQKPVCNLLDHAFVEKVKVREQTVFCLRHVALREPPLEKDTGHFSGPKQGKIRDKSIFQWSYRQISGPQFYAWSELYRYKSGQLSLNSCNTLKIPEHIHVFYMRIHLAGLPLNFAQLSNYWTKRFGKLKPYITTVVLIFDTCGFKSEMYRLSSKVFSTGDPQGSSTWTCQETRKIIHLTLQMNNILRSLMTSHNVILAHILPLSFSQYIRCCINEVQQEFDASSSFTDPLTEYLGSRTRKASLRKVPENVSSNGATPLSRDQIKKSTTTSQSAPALYTEVESSDTPPHLDSVSCEAFQKKFFSLGPKNRPEHKDNSRLSFLFNVFHNNLCPKRHGGGTTSSVEFSKSSAPSIEQDQEGKCLTKKCLNYKNVDALYQEKEKHERDLSFFSQSPDSYTALSGLPYPVYRDTPWESLASSSNTLHEGESCSFSLSGHEKRRNSLFSDSTFSIASLDFSDKCLY